MVNKVTTSWRKVKQKAAAAKQAEVELMRQRMPWTMREDGYIMVYIYKYNIYNNTYIYIYMYIYMIL